MKTALKSICLLSSIAALAMPARADQLLEVSVISCGPVMPSPVLSAAKPVVQMAILLDTSNSMDGLIDQARSQLWKVVNELATTKRDRQTPSLQVALYEYGNSRLTPGEGYVRMVLPLSDDLDAVSEKLFALKTDGGDEYCGWVIKSAIDGLKWSDAKDAYKVIFIAGNEPFSQGSVDYHTSCSAAIAKGIMVNTIHCGDEQTGIQTGWKDGATLADGAFMCIDQNRAVVAIAAPQDEEIAKLSTALNSTYLPYGAKGGEYALRQEAQDTAATASPAAAAAGAPVERAVAKSSALYRNSSWDLVDAAKDKTVKLEELKSEELPEAMQKLKPEERQQFVDAKANERADIQQKIQSLNSDREKFVAEKRKTQSGDKTDTLDEAMINAVREQFTKSRK